MHRALGPLLDDLAGAAAAAARLAAAHRDTVTAGRTLLQHAVPTTFGLTAAGWLTGLDDAARRLANLRATRLAVQLGGARDVTLLAQTEVAEVHEGGPERHGGSSTLPDKHNPIAAVSALAAAAQAPGLVANLLAAATQEHQRAAGAWHAEWQPLRGLLSTVGSAAAWLRHCLEHLDVDAERMRANLDHTGGLLLAERVSTALAPKLGRLAAQDLVGGAATEAVDSGKPFADVLRGRPELDGVDVDALLDPAGYLGSAGAFVDRALAAHHARPTGDAT